MGPDAMIFVFWMLSFQPDFSLSSWWAQWAAVVASGPITSWEIDGETVETVADFIFLGSKITADGDHSNEMKRHSLEGKLWST